MDQIFPASVHQSNLRKLSLGGHFIWMPIPMYVGTSCILYAYSSPWAPSTLPSPTQSNPGTSPSLHLPSFHPTVSQLTSSAWDVPHLPPPSLLQHTAHLILGPHLPPPSHHTVSLISHPALDGTSPPPTQSSLHLPFTVSQRTSCIPHILLPITDQHKQSQRITSRLCIL